MNRLIIDTAKVISALTKRSAELDNLHTNPQGPTADDKTEQRVQISYLITQVNSEITLLRLISAHLSAAVEVRRPTIEEIAAIQTALSKLHKVISREQTFDQTLKTVTTILEAAAAVSTAAKSGKPQQA